MSGAMADVLDVPPSKYLCLTILGYRKPGMSEGAYRRHMTKVSAPMTKDLMVKYGVKRWTMIHNPSQTRQLMTKIYDRQMSNIADFDCFSQVVFHSVEHYKLMKEDPWYKKHLFNDHENFADTARSKMTIGWIEEWVNDGRIRDGLEFSCDRVLSNTSKPARVRGGVQKRTSCMQTRARTRQQAKRRLQLSS